MFSFLKASWALMRSIINWRWENLFTGLAQWQNTPGTQHCKRWNNLEGSQLEDFN